MSLGNKGKSTLRELTFEGSLIGLWQKVREDCTCDRIWVFRFPECLKGFLQSKKGQYIMIEDSS